MSTYYRQGRGNRVDGENLVCTMVCFNPYMFRGKKLKPSVEASVTQEVVVLQIWAKTPSPPHPQKMLRVEDMF